MSLKVVMCALMPCLWLNGLGSLNYCAVPRYDSKADCICWMIDQEVVGSGSMYL